MGRTILHVDINNFYASVECLEHPEYRNMPLAVGGDEKLRHGIVLAKNNIAKAYGVKTAEALWQARQKCPQLVIMPPQFELYSEYSARSREMLGRYSDRVEPFGMDEAWIDISTYAPTEKDGKCIADEIRRRYRDELGITASVGVSFNKVFAKLGSDMKKPDATTVISQESFKQTVWELPVEDLLFVGPSTARKLRLRGIDTIGRLAVADKALIRSWLGASGEKLQRFANGIDDSPVMPKGAEAVIKSIGNSTTPPRDVECEADAVALLQAMAECVAARLRKERMLCTTVVLHVRKGDLYSFERQTGLQQPTRIAVELRREAVRLLRNSWDMHTPIRSLGVRATGLISENSPIQLSLFEDEAARIRREKAERVIDVVRERYGKNAISLGAAAYVKELGRIPDFEDTPLSDCAFYTGM